MAELTQKENLKLSGIIGDGLAPGETFPEPEESQYKKTAPAIIGRLPRIRFPDEPPEATPVPEPKPEKPEHDKKITNPDMSQIELKRGKYSIIWETGKTIKFVKFTDKNIIVKIDDKNKRVKVHSITENKGKINTVITVIDNPIPLLLIGYAVLGLAGLTAGAFFVSEVNELSDNLTNAAIIGGVVYVLYLFKDKI